MGLCQVEGKLTQGRVNVYSCMCVCVCFSPCTCIHKVGSLVRSRVFPANVSIRQKDVSLRDPYIYVCSNIPLPYLGYIILQIAWGQLQRYGRAIRGDQLSQKTRSDCRRATKAVKLFSAPDLYISRYTPKYVAWRATNIFKSTLITPQDICIYRYIYTRYI